MSTIWSDLKFSAASSARSVLGGVGFHWTTGNDLLSGVSFKSRSAYRSAIAHVAQQTAMQMAEAQVNKLFPRYQRMLENRLRQEALDQSKDNAYATLIRGGEDETSEYGSICTSDGKTIIARDQLSRRVSDALILSYKGDKDITYSFPPVTTSERYTLQQRSFLSEAMSSSNTIEHEVKREDVWDVTTKDVVHIDLAPLISLQTSKNLVMTQVQGRDFTRKELIGGGDLSFSVSGSVVSFTPGEYPSAAVQRLIKIAQYKGIVSVSNPFFNQFNVKHIILRDFNLSPQEFKNIQPYSFTCVAIEADEIILRNDTIGAINQAIQESKMNAWYRFILNNKLAEVAAGTVANAANSALSKGLDIEGMLQNI